MKILIVLIGFVITGCSNLLLNNQQAAEIVLRRCPPLVNYTELQQKQALLEIRKLHSDSQILAIINDYSKLREACKVYRSKLKQIAKKR